MLKSPENVPGIMMSQNVYFYYPSICLGGAELLFTRLAIHMVKYNLAQPVLIDNVNGLYSDLVSGEKIKVIYINKIEKIAINEGVIILPPSHLLEIGNTLNIGNDVKILLWSIHPLNMESILPLFPLVHKLSLKVRLFLYRFITPFSFVQYVDLVRYISSLQALCLMDCSNYKTITLNGNIVNLEKNYLPIPIELARNKSRAKEILSSPINIAWLGRIADFKVNSLIKIYNDLSLYTRTFRCKMVFHIIGDGELLELVKKHCQNTPFLQVVYIGALKPSLLEEYLLENVQILIAMGTSCLEGGKLAIPSILVDVFPQRPPKQYTYRWLYETTDFSLGDYVYSDVLTEHYIADIIEGSNLSDHGERCLEYVKSNHSIEQVTLKMLKLSSETHLDGRLYNNVLNGKVTFMMRLLQRVKNWKRKLNG